MYFQNIVRICRIKFNIFRYFTTHSEYVIYHSFFAFEFGRPSQSFYQTCFLMPF
jgi:hypothetical protein